jgi:Fe-S cluster assembly protein SufD
MLQCESMEAYHTSATYVVAGPGANCSAHSISLGGALVRNDVVAVLGGGDGTCTLNGLYLADGERLVDNHTTIDHVNAVLQKSPGLQRDTRGSRQERL